MASAQDGLYEIFLEIAGEQTSSLAPVVKAGQELAGSLKEVTRQITATVVPQSVGLQAAASGGGGVVDVLETVGSTVLKNALGAAPLIRGIISLFGGGDKEAPETPLVKYARPASIAFQAADTPSGFTQVDYDQQGLPRAFRQEAESTPVRREANQQVTVNVQAMDARSFLDRSTEIAAAVREAMLNLNSLNDVVNDL